MRIPVPSPKPVSLPRSQPRDQGVEPRATAAMAADQLQLTERAKPAKLPAAASLSLTPPVELTPSELRRLLSGAAQPAAFARIFQRAPGLAEYFKAHREGAEVYALLQKAGKTPLNRAEIRTIQAFLVHDLHLNIAYRGSADGVDGVYGQRTHKALVDFLAAAPASALAPPLAASPSPANLPSDLRALAKMYLPKLQSLQTGSAANRALYQLLKQAASRPLPVAEVRHLQTLLVNAGQKLAYPGHPTGIDGDFGPRSRAALVQVLATATASTQPQPNPQPNPAQPSAADPKALLHGLLQPGTSLQAFGRAFARLSPALQSQAASLQADGQTLQALLQAASQGSLKQSQVQSLQKILVASGQDLSYPGHATGIDGDFGRRSQVALLKLMESWVQHTAPSELNAGPYPRYDQMLSDHVLDMTLAIGYDEGTSQSGSANLAEERKVLAELRQRGFQENTPQALEWLKAAGVEPQAQSGTRYFVKAEVGQQEGQAVHAIVRLVQAGNGDHGASSRAAALEGMNQSDVFMYGGHARYGTGPDFDRNFTVTVDWTGVPNAPSSGQVRYDNYDQLKELLGGNDAAAIRQLKALEKAGKITVTPSNEGNLRMAEDNLHPYEFGSHLMDSALEGVHNTLAQEIQGDHYRLWLFNGCRTRDYVRPIRQAGQHNPALNERHLDVMTTEQTLYWRNIGASLTSFMDGVMAHQSAPELVQSLRQANPEQAEQATHSEHGFGDNPLLDPSRF